MKTKERRPPPSEPTTPPEGTLYPVPPSIANDCSRDVTAELNEWIASVPNGTSSSPSVLAFGAGKCYRVDRTLGTTYGGSSPSGLRRSNLVFWGNGAIIDGSYVLPPAYTNRAGFSFMYGTGIRVRGFTIKGNHPSPCNASQSDPNDPCKFGPDGGGGYDGRYEWHHGIAFFAGTEVAALDNHIYNVYGDGVTVAQGDLGEYTRNAILQGNVIDGTGRMGIGITAADGVQVQANRFDRVSYHVLDLEPEARGPVRNIAIARNQIHRHYTGFVISASGECNDRSNITITNNVMNRAGITAFAPIALDPLAGAPGCLNMSGVTITSNTLRRTDGSAGYYDSSGVNRSPYQNATLWLHNITDLRVNDNRIIQTGRTNTSALWLSGLRGVKEVKRNDMREAAYVYNYGGNFDGSNPGTYDGPEVDACGNVTSVGPSRPRAC